MDRCQASAANPASLIRQARRSTANLVGREDDINPMAPRYRRASAPPMCYDEPEDPSLGGGLRGKTFKTKVKATVRTFASAISMKITELPEGWKVVKAQTETACPGWVAIEPRGYVLEKDLAPASPLPSSREVPIAELLPAAVEAPRSACRSAPDAPLRSARQSLRSARKSDGGYGSSPQQMPPALRGPGAQSPRSACTTPKGVLGSQGQKPKGSMLSPRPAQVSRHSPRQARATPSPEAVEVLALKEEHIHLRESNVGLREKELEKRKELEELGRARETMAREVQQLERSRSTLKIQHDAEERELQLDLKKQEEKMKEKLVRCRDVVAKAVGSIDDLVDKSVAYAAQDTTSTRLSIGVLSSQGSADSDFTLANDDLVQAKAVAAEAGAEVCLLLDTWSEADNSLIMKENTDTPILATNTKKMPEEASRAERAPLRDCNENEVW